MNKQRARCASTSTSDSDDVGGLDDNTNSLHGSDDKQHGGSDDYYDEDDYNVDNGDDDLLDYLDEDEDEEVKPVGKGKKEAKTKKGKERAPVKKTKKKKKKKPLFDSAHDNNDDDEFWVESDNEVEQEQFTILTRDQLLAKQMTLLDSIAGELGLSKWEVALLLQYFEWSVDKLHSKYWDNSNKVCLEAGMRVCVTEDSPTENPQKNPTPLERSKEIPVVQDELITTATVITTTPSTITTDTLPTTSTPTSTPKKKKKKKKPLVSDDSTATDRKPKKKKKKKTVPAPATTEASASSSAGALSVETTPSSSSSPTKPSTITTSSDQSLTKSSSGTGSKEGSTRKSLGEKFKLKKRSSKADTALTSSATTTARQEPTDQASGSEASPLSGRKKKESKLPLKLTSKIKNSKRKRKEDAAERKSDKAAAKEEKKRNAAATKKTGKKKGADSSSGNQKDGSGASSSASTAVVPAPFRKPEIIVVYEEHPAWLDSPVVECLICFDDIPQGEAFHLACKHGPYCGLCWQNHLAVTVQTSGAAGILNTTCMWPNCPTKVNYADFQKLAAPEHFARYNYFFMKDYVDCNKDFSFCPNPSCTNVILFNGSGKPAALVKCTCAYQFCFACGMENHNPVTCEQLDKWNQRNMDDQESLKLIMATTKRCFHCNIPTTRTDGCNHMTCRKEQGGCGGQWCWMCRGDWKTHGPHTGGFYSCNKYESSEGKKLDDEAAKLKEDSDRYLHYFERYFAHSIASSNIQHLLEKAAEKANNYSTSNDSNTDFFIDAVKLLAKCRHILKYTHVYGFYLPDGSKGKDFFEYLQANAEGITERLARMVMSPLGELDVPDFKNRIRVTNEYITNLVDALEEGLGVEGLGTK
eukprot:TRINITY_DN1054_c6_g1_i1.p1 TRINITY_DN1054_c6_g1~~TRINITY_DN1054_c6_g1_i1.p1  ORF type:complete len:867 (-),score=222.38 TRINITY_DN1054_c6_g1_i1:16-2616(-)